MRADRLLDAAIITTASVLLVGVAALLLFTVTAVLERWIEQPDAAPASPRLSAIDVSTVEVASPVVFDQDADHDERRAS